MQNMFVFLSYLLLEWKAGRYLCVGIDPDEKDVERIYGAFNMSNLLSYCKTIVDATFDICACYKLNYAFFECHGWKGMLVMEKVVQYIRQKEKQAIADGKKGDIQNTQVRYAQATQKMGFTAATISPYMGTDTVQPFFDQGIFTFVLAKTTNDSSQELQELEVNFAKIRGIVVKIMADKFPGGCGFVVGAAKNKGDASDFTFRYCKDYSQNNIKLIPGVGAQGGELELTVAFAYDKTTNGGFIVNVSRGLVPKDCTKVTFESLVREHAKNYNRQIQGAVVLAKAERPPVHF